MTLSDYVHTDYRLRPLQHKGKTCLVVGGGVQVWKEYEQAMSLCPDAHVLAVNAVGCYVPDPLHYWFSLHCFHLKTWHTVRKMLYKGHGYQSPQLWSLRHTGEGVQQGDINAIWSFGDPTISSSAKHGGSLEDSGFFAMCMAVVLGYSRV